MNGQELVDAVRENRATELDRLGADKYLIAATGADLERAPVLRTAAESAASGREVFERWAEEETGDAASAFRTAAEREGDHFDRVVGSLAALPNDDADAADTLNADDDPLHEALTGTDGTVERLAAGFVGRPLVTDRTRLQAVNFFVNEADEDRGGLIRDLRSDAQARLQEGIDLLDSTCEAGNDWERAERGAVRVIDAAYDGYVDALEAMGVDPKPVC